jgi:hypothetical protein
LGFPPPVTFANVCAGGVTPFIVKSISADVGDFGAPFMPNGLIVLINVVFSTATFCVATSIAQEASAYSYNMSIVPAGAPDFSAFASTR